jgi:formylglycine-generating enzyme
MSQGGGILADPVCSCGKMRDARVALALSTVLAAGCAGILGVEDLGVFDEPVSPREAGADADSGAGPEDAAGDATGDAGPPPVTKDDAGCPSGRGPAMVALGPTADGGTYCMDRTEVSVAQYGQFLQFAALTAFAPDAQAAACAWNTATLPSQSVNGALPVEAVDWCDAKAYCAWAGKRLCGSIGGGALPPGAAGPLVSEWSFACTNGGTTAYPYGATYQAGACNIVSDAGVVETGSRPGCATSRGVLDLTGNVWEWIDQCTPKDGGPTLDACLFLGGEYASPASYDCAVASGLDRASRPVNVGIRCCADRP